MSELTPRQSEILEYIRERIRNGLPPSVREIGEQFGIGSPNGVMCHLKTLGVEGVHHADLRQVAGDSVDVRSAVGVRG